MRSTIIWLALSIGCFNPKLPIVSCDEGACPAGLVCNAEKRCVDRGQGGRDSGVLDSASNDSNGLDGPSYVETLIEDGLIARWFIDEAQEGTKPPFLLDAQGDTQLEINYADTFFIGSNNSRTGLAIGRESELPIRGGASTELRQGGPIAEALMTSGAFTMEFVAEGNLETAPFFMALGPSLDFFQTTIGAARLRVGGDIQGQWRLELDSRRVLHVVYDSEQLLSALYVDGSLVEPLGDDPSGSPIVLDEETRLSLGNSIGSTRPLHGIMYYAAIYDRALTEEDIANNTMRLAEFDDATP